MNTLKISTFFMMLCMTFQALAQTTAPSGSTNSTKMTKQEGKQEKEQWLDMYNKFKPKLDELKTRSSKQDPNSDFSRNVSKLDQMAGDFRSKIDQYDAASPEQQKQMRPAMEKQKSEMDALYKTAKGQYDQMHNKTGSKTKGEPQPK